MENKNILKQLDIIYLEDDPLANKKITESLSYIVKSIRSALNVDEALELFNNEKPDLIISDIEMKDKNGFVFIEEAREKDPFIPIVILTSYKNENFLLKAANNSIDRYVTKPLTFNKLIDTLNDCVKKLTLLNRLSIKFSNKTKYNIKTEEFTLPNNTNEKLSLKEQYIFSMLLLYKNSLLSYSAIEDNSPSDFKFNKNNIKIIINKLRKIIGKDTIINDSQLGYRLKL